MKELTDSDKMIIERDKIIRDNQEFFNDLIYGLNQIIKRIKEKLL